MEVIPAGSKQYQPSSVEFDSGVDDPSELGRYVVWNGYMNSHIKPTFVISFKSSSWDGTARIQRDDPNMTVHAFITLLSKHLNPAKRNLVMKRYSETRVPNELSVRQLLNDVRSIVGDENLIRPVYWSQVQPEQGD